MAEISETELYLRWKHKNHFKYFAPRVLKIRSKSGDIIPFVMNKSQEYIFKRLEEQKKKTGRVKALVLKSRQQGCSTMIMARFFHQTIFSKGKQAFILTHLEEATSNLFSITKRFFVNCIAALQPKLKASNARELLFSGMDSGYKVSTAGSAGTGRSSTIQLFLGSEIAYWKDPRTHISGVLQAVPDEPGTEIILESTSSGKQGLFYEMCKDAMQGRGQYQLIFTPWFWQSEYCKEIPEDFKLLADDEQYMKQHNLTKEQIYWRSLKILELGGIHEFRKEYPATPDEAFEADVTGALWNYNIINNTRVTEMPAHNAFKRIVVAIDPSGGSEKGNDEVGIVVAGVGLDGHGYLLEDGSGRYTPNEWGKKGVALYHKWKADRIVGEANFGGDMIEHVIRTADKTISYKKVIASRGKLLRAEPVYAFYERGMIHHVGSFIVLEDQLCSWVVGQKSPDRLDAMVWAFTELMITGTSPGRTMNVMGL